MIRKLPFFYFRVYSHGGLEGRLKSKQRPKLQAAAKADTGSQNPEMHIMISGNKSYSAFAFALSKSQR
jgi:hypothetical protein